MSGETANKDPNKAEPKCFSGKFLVKVKPNSRIDKYLGVDKSGRHIVAIAEPAMDNKANIALIRFFRKEFGVSVRIKSGLANRVKLLEA